MGSKPNSLVLHELLWHLKWNFHMFSSLTEIISNCIWQIKMNNFDFKIENGYWVLQDYPCFQDVNCRYWWHFMPFNSYAINGSRISFGRANKSYEFYGCTVDPWIAASDKWQKTCDFRSAEDESHGFMFDYICQNFAALIHHLPFIHTFTFFTVGRSSLRIGFCHFFAIVPSNRLAILHNSFLWKLAVMMVW